MSEIEGKYYGLTEMSDGEAGASLSLDSIKNISHSKTCHIGYFEGVQRENKSSLKGIRTNIRCKKWSCDYCRPILNKTLRKRLYNGNFSEFVDPSDPKSKYNYKLLTLTLPGAEWRSQRTPDQAYTDLSKSWDKLNRALKKQYGKFHSLRVVEPQRDGFPHFHILLSGKGIGKKSVLNTIRNLWSEKYFNAFANVDIRIVNNFKHAVRYITKYLLKNERTYGFKGKKYSTSKGALLKKVKMVWEKCKFYSGLVRGEPDKVEVFERELDLTQPDIFIEKDIKAFVNLTMITGVEAPF